jgi:ribonuclease P protein component
MPTTISTATASSGAGDRPRYDLPRGARVVRNKEFSRIYSRGLRAGGKHLSIVALRRRETGHRVGLSVSKAHGCAVVRNKIKRIFREAFRLERPTLGGQFDIVMIPRQRPGKFRLDEVRRELRRLVGNIDAGRGRRRRPRQGDGRS